MLTNEEKRIVRQNAILNNGYYDKHSNWNAIKMINGNIYRDRVETLIIKEGKYVFIKLAGEKGKYKLPGGSLGKDITPETQASNECHEETHFEIENLQSTGITYKINYTDTKRSKDNEYQYGIKYIGAFTQVFVADYSGEFTGTIAPADEDPFIRSGKWYTFKEAFDIFNQWHKEALIFYIKTNNLNDVEDYTTEGYFTNRIKNHFQLRDKKIVEMDINQVHRIIAELTRKYHVEKSRFHPNNEASLGMYRLPIQRESSNGINYNVEFVVNFALDKYSPAFAAQHPQTKRYYIILSPVFFEEYDKEKQLFIFLHEAGHIRLGHVLYKNMPKIGNRVINNEARLFNIARGKVQYTELNADTYAILNGAKRHAILDTTFRDDDYMLAPTNMELARRYDKVTQRKIKFDTRYGTYENGQDIEDGEYTSESYFTNWFSNEFKLWSKEIRTDTPSKTVEGILDILSKSYKKHKNDKKFGKGAFTFASMQMPNYKEGEKFSENFIQFCINFTDRSNGPAYAMASDSGFQLVIVCPEFFDMKFETQKFVLLHEIGHIRLGHTKPENLPCDIFGNPIYSRKRSDAILNSGKTIYTELNADLYAVLNGAKLYSILDVAFDKDFDSKGNPFIYGNYEIADRYKKATERSLRRDLFKGMPRIGG